MQPELYRWEEILADQLAPPPNAHVSVLPSKNIILARTQPDSSVNPSCHAKTTSPSSPNQESKNNTNECAESPLFLSPFPQLGFFVFCINSLTVCCCCCCRGRWWSCCCLVLLLWDGFCEILSILATCLRCCCWSKHSEGFLSTFVQKGLRCNCAESEWVCWTLKDWEYNLLTDIRSKGREELLLQQQEKRGKEGWRWWHLWVGARIAAMPCSDVWTLVTRWVQTKSLLQATKKPIMFQFSGCVWEYTDHNMINFALDHKKSRSLPLPTCCL